MENIPHDIMTLIWKDTNMKSLINSFQVSKKLCIFMRKHFNKLVYELSSHSNLFNFQRLKHRMYFDVDDYFMLEQGEQILFCKEISATNHYNSMIYLLTINHNIRYHLYRFFVEQDPQLYFPEYYNYTELEPDNYIVAYNYDMKEIPDVMLCLKKFYGNTIGHDLHTTNLIRTILRTLLVL